MLGWAKKNSRFSSFPLYQLYQHALSFENVLKSTSANESRSPQSQLCTLVLFKIGKINRYDPKCPCTEHTD